MNVVVAVWVKINKTLEKAAQAQPAPPAQTPAIQAPPRTKAAEAAAPSLPAAPAAIPTIKLKIGGGSATPNGAAPPAPSKSASKSKAKKPKEPKLSEVPPPAPHVSAPPPPPSSAFDDLDDGTADLLQEVIAVEEEKKRQQHQTPHKEKERERPTPAPTAEKGKERHAPKIVIGKRKMDTTEDEILALATPAKRERGSVPIPGPSSTPAVPTPPASASKRVSPPQPAKNGVSSQKVKEKPPKPSPKTSPPAQEPTPPPTRVTLKGKEKEISRPATPSSTKPKKAGAQTTPTPANEKKCREILNLLGKQSDAFIFKRPVDPIQDGCPTYAHLCLSRSCGALTYLI